MTEEDGEGESLAEEQSKAHTILDYEAISAEPTASYAKDM